MLNILIKRNLAKNVCNILHISFRHHCELPAIVMNNGNEMPIIGFGTGSSTNDYMAMEKLENIDAQNISENITKAVGLAIDAGYRHIDSSYLYQNEHEIGNVLKKKISNNVVTRENLFITSKLWNTFHDPDNVCLACQQTLQDLDLDYLDMYIMQSPMGFQQSEELFPMCNGNILYSDDDYIGTWKAMEDLVKLKLCKNIGISNFNIKQIKRLLKNCQIVPQTLQIEMHPYMTQKKLVNYAKSHDICITAYAPMGFSQKSLAKADEEITLLKAYKILQLAEKHKRTPAQILLRYQIQLGHAVIEKSTDRKQITENINIFDFELCPDDVTNIDSLNHNLRYFKLSRAYGHPYHPFETSLESTNDYMAMEKLENIDAQNISENITKAVGLAIDAGYRHIDSSYLYQNEHEIGNVLKKKISNNVVTRENLFITSKLWNTFHDPDNVCLACQQTLQDLDLDYLDMYIMQSPMGFQQSEELFPMCNGNILYSDDDYIGTWKAMEDLVKLKLCKNIGISNFNIKQIKRLLKNCQIVPQTLQIEMHPYMTQKKLVNYAKSHDICITAYAPMGFSQKSLAKADEEITLLKAYKILQLAEKHKRTPAQILLRYQIQLGHAVIEKSTDRKQITENINIFDFELCPDDVTNIDSLNHNLRYFKLSRAYGHPYHPFETSLESTNDYMAMEKLENIDAQNISENITKAVGLAIDAGYRHIDSSYLYQNEHEIGNVLKKKISNNVVTRENLFITSKLWNTFHDPDNVCLACQQTLQDLDLDYLDMYIMQSPMGFQQSEELFPMCNGNILYSDDDYIGTWKAMEDLVKLKLCKNIGISNFNIKQIKRLLKNCQIVPQTLQIEMHPYMTQKKLVNYAKSHDICITAYAPMGFSQKSLAKADEEITLLKAYKILQLAEKHKRTPAQILLRYQIQLGHAVIEKSTDRKQITENINIFDFELCPDDVTNIDSLNHNLRYFKLSRAYGHPYHPFETSLEVKKCKLQND